MIRNLDQCESLTAHGSRCMLGGHPTEDGIRCWRHGGPVSRDEYHVRERTRQEQKQSRRRSEMPPPPRTVRLKRLRALAKLPSLDTYPRDVERPKTRGDCVDGPRPCPFVSCRFHLYLDVLDTGSLKINRPDLEPWEMDPSCALDVADMASITLEEAGEVMNLTRERIRQLESKGLRKLRAARVRIGDLLGEVTS